MWEHLDQCRAGAELMDDLESRLLRNEALQAEDFDAIPAALNPFINAYKRESKLGRRPSIFYDLVIVLCEGTKFPLPGKRGTQADKLANYIEKSIIPRLDRYALSRFREEISEYIDPDGGRHIPLPMEQQNILADLRSELFDEISRRKNGSRRALVFQPIRPPFLYGPPEPLYPGWKGWDQPSAELVI